MQRKPVAQGIHKFVKLFPNRTKNELSTFCTPIIKYHTESTSGFKATLYCMELPESEKIQINYKPFISVLN